RKALAACPEPLRAWDWHYLRRLAEGGLLTLRGHPGPLHSVAFHPNGRHLATADDSHVYVWDALEGKKIRQFQAHPGAHIQVTYSPDGKLLATGGDRTVHLWDPMTGQLQRALPGHTEAVSWVAFAPDGKELATASHDGTVRIWDTATGRSRL